MASTPRGSKIVLGLTSFATLGTILYSHYSQVWDKEVMRAGVERDKERIRIKKKRQIQEN